MIDRLRAVPLAAAAVVAAVGAGTALVLTRALASDHQDTPEVELSPRLDINDVYAFPGSSPSRIALLVTTSSPLTPAASTGATFDPDILYQIKVDNTGDAVEDLVLQFTFTGTGSAQQVHLRGPLAPARTGTGTTVLDVTPAVSGPINTVLGSPSSIQLFAGLRDDPFFIDLEQFFRIIPDRRPVQGPLSKIGPKPEASAFRGPGEAVDFLAGLNALALAVELPVAMLLAPGTSGSDPSFGVWATTSR
jgi:hypothetical protein